MPVHNGSFQQWTNLSSDLTFPSIFRAEISLDRVGDTYFDMSGYSKGYLYVNGHLLGRYWSIGPQKRLFCPGVWLR